jgi:hypothetical protein
VDCPFGTTCELPSSSTSLGDCVDGCDDHWDCETGEMCGASGDCETMSDEGEEGNPCYMGGGSLECDDIDPGEDRDPCDYYETLPSCGDGLVCSADTITDGDGNEVGSMVMGTCEESSGTVTPTPEESPDDAWEPSPEETPILTESPVV